uniref:Uncharacterized protein n=1 Tax=Romanomermis culicivorax TaxID=13658 RepID=A0A915JEV5_ROMCU
MQQLISTTAAAAIARNNLLTPWPLPVTSWFHGEESHDIYIPNETLYEIERALAYGWSPARVKPKAPSTDTLYNNEFCHTAPGEDNIPCITPQRCPPPTVNPYGFWDYPPNDYYDHPQPCFDLLCTSHHEEDSRIKKIVDNMHPLRIDGSPTKK